MGRREIAGADIAEDDEVVAGERTDVGAVHFRDEVVLEAMAAGRAVVATAEGGPRFLLDDDEVNSGRHPDSDIFLDDVTVSRKHANFRREGETFVVRDVGSLNGTYVNRERIDEATLHTGDEVQIGKFRLVFYAGRA